MKTLPLPVRVALLILLAGCGHARLAELSTAPGAGWRMYGGDIGRRNVSPDSIAPPLVPAWEFDAGAGFGSSSLAFADSTLFVSTLTGEVHALATATGKEFGSWSFGSSIMGTPVVDGNQLFVALGHDEEGLISYNMRTGAKPWKIRTGDIETSPLLIDSQLVVATLREGILCVSKTSGAIAWRFRIPVPEHPPMIHSSPASDGAIVAFGCDDGILYAVGVADGTLRWRGTTGGAILASPSVDGGTVYAASLDGCVYAFDVAAGTLRWKRQLGAPIHASLAIDGTHVYAGTAGRDFVALDKSTGAVDWKFTANGAIGSAPIVSHGVVYFGSIDRNLYALNCVTGAQMWKFETQGRIKSTPVIRKGQLFVPVEDTSVLAFSEGPAQ